MPFQRELALIFFNGSIDGRVLALERADGGGPGSPSSVSVPGCTEDQHDERITRDTFRARRRPPHGWAPRNPRDGLPDRAGGPSRHFGEQRDVKIHDGAGEPSHEVRNQPHVCTFHLHFFFADPEQSGTWEIQHWSPGDKGVVVMTGTYDTVGDGEDRQPETGAYKLPDGHYKLFWDGDTGKHDKLKVFWVRCAPTTQPVTAATPTPTPAGAGQPAGATPTPTPVGGQQPAGATSTPIPNENNGNVGGIGGSPAPGGGSPGGESGEVLGVTGTSPVTPPPTDTAAAVTSSAADGWQAAVLMIAGLIGGMAVIRYARLLPVAVRRSQRRRFR
jgi:hypothetical protein